jgi:hypothetical protein
MKRLISTPCLEVRWEPRWPAAAIGFYGNGKRTRRVFVVLFAPLVILVGRRA